MVQAKQYSVEANKLLEFPDEEDLINYAEDDGTVPARIEIPPEIVLERSGEGTFGSLLIKPKHMSCTSKIVNPHLE